MRLFRRRREPAPPAWPEPPTTAPAPAAATPTLRSRDVPADTPYQRHLADFCDHLDETPDSLTSIAIVGESYRQDAFVSIAGPKERDGKHMFVGVTLRCEPDNPHDPNAVRVEVMGQHVGYVKRGRAKQLHPRIARCGGAIECNGMIVGGWHDDDSEGHYGIRVWLRPTDRERLGMKSG